MSIQTLAPDRDEIGMWCHPKFDAIFGDREMITPEEFHDWKDKSGIAETILQNLFDEDDDRLAAIGYNDGDPDVSMWDPQPPDGRDWHLLFISDHEDGPNACWYLLDKAEGGAV